MNFLLSNFSHSFTSIFSIPSAYNLGNTPKNKTKALIFGCKRALGTNSNEVLLWLFDGRLVEDHSLVQISMGPPLILLHQVWDLYGRDHAGLLVLHDLLTSGDPLMSQNRSRQFPWTQLLHHSHPIWSSNHSRQLPKEDG